MSTEVLINSEFILGGYRLTGLTNSLELTIDIEMKDFTTFTCQGNRVNRPGLQTVQVTGGVFVDYGDMDALLFDRIGADRAPVTLGPRGATENEVAYFFEGVNGAIAPLAGEIGELAHADVDLHSDNSPVVHGRFMAVGTKTASGNSTGYNLGPVPSVVEKLYSALHVTRVSGAGASLVAKIESGVAGFGAPTNRITHATMTTPGWDWKRVYGPIADTHYRAVLTVAGASPEFDIYLSVGIR